MVDGIILIRICPRERRSITAGQEPPMAFQAAH